MAQYLGVGSGADGTIPASGTYDGTKLSCSGAQLSTTLSYTGSFSVGDIVLIIQMRGTGAGAWEKNQIVSANTVLVPLANTYTDSGESQAQVIKINEYTGGVVSGALTSDTWDGNVGGVLPIMWNGKLTVTGSLTVTEKGFRGGEVGRSSDASNTETGDTGEGEQNAAVAGSLGTANPPTGGEGGGGEGDRGPDEGAGGGGASYATAGEAGDNSASGYSGGSAGNTFGATDLTTIFMGPGGGGGGAAKDDPGALSGGIGGGIVFLFGNELDASAGGVFANGGDGDAGNTLSGGCGGAAGGSIIGKVVTATIGTDKLLAIGGAGGVGNGSGGDGGDGGDGRVRLECCNLTGTSNPAASQSLGGFSYCSGILGSMI